jgi:hypothetical protein
MSRKCWIDLHPAVMAPQVTPPFLRNNHLVPRVEIPEVAPHVPPILCNTQASSNGALELTTRMLCCFVRNAFVLVQQLLHSHSLLVYPVKSCQVAWEGACLQCGITVGAGHVACILFLARLKVEAYAVIRSSWQLSPDPTGSANHGLCFQAVNFEGSALYLAASVRTAVRECTPLS